MKQLIKKQNSLNNVVKSALISISLSFSVIEGVYQLDPFGINNTIYLSDACKLLRAYDREHINIIHSDPLKTGNCEDSNIKIKYSGDLEGRLKLVESIDAEAPYYTANDIPLTNEREKYFSKNIDSYKLQIVEILQDERPPTFWFHVLPDAYENSN